MRLAFVEKDSVSAFKDESIPQGEALGHVYYTAPSGRVYNVPIISDGKGGEVRWMADVLWADLPIESRLGFAVRGGGLLSKDDLSEVWNLFGEWKKSGEYISLFGQRISPSIMLEE